MVNSLEKTLLTVHEVSWQKKWREKERSRPPKKITATTTASENVILKKMTVSRWEIMAIMESFRSAHC